MSSSQSSSTSDPANSQPGKPVTAKPPIRERLAQSLIQSVIQPLVRAYGTCQTR